MSVDREEQVEISEVNELIHTINGLIELANGELIETDDGGLVEAEQVDWQAINEMGLFESQLQEIELGLKQNLPVGIYAKDCYNWKQMREIRCGLLSKVDVGIYKNPLYSDEQMKEIRLGLEAQLDVSSYANLLYSATDMLHKRRKLLTESYSMGIGAWVQKIQDDDTGIWIRINNDCMEAFMMIPHDVNRTFSVMELKRFLKKYEIVYGLLEENLQKLVVSQIRDKEIKVAQGTLPLTGKDGYYKLMFQRNLPGLPKVLPDGRVDYTHVVVADTVLAGQIIAKYIASERGEDGTTVTGIKVAGKNGKDLPPLTGQGFKADEENKTYWAEYKGYVSYNEPTGELNVWNTYMADGDVNRYSGSVVFDGTVHIKGSVYDMAVVKASGDVIIDGFVSGAMIQAGNNVMIRGGVNAAGKGKIEAAGRIIGNFFETVTLAAQGSIEGNYFLNCDIETDEKLIARGGKAKIMGGNIVALGGVESAIIGNSANNRTSLSVGDMDLIDQKEQRLNSSLKKATREKEMLEEGRERLIDLLGEEVVRENSIFQRTCLAIETKAEECVNLEKQLEHLGKIRLKAERATIRASKELQPGVLISINGRKKENQNLITSANLTKDTWYTGKEDQK